jgi:hypothetical protein
MLGPRAPRQRYGISVYVIYRFTSYICICHISYATICIGIYALVRFNLYLPTDIHSMFVNKHSSSISPSSKISIPSGNFDVVYKLLSLSLSLSLSPLYITTLERRGERGAAYTQPLFTLSLSFFCSSSRCHPEEALYLPTFSHLYLPSFSHLFDHLFDCQ